MTTNARRIFWQKKNKLMNIQSVDSNKIVTVDTIGKSWKNAVLGKYAANDWLMYNRSGKHATNLKCLLCCRYVEHIAKLKGFKSE